MMYKHVTLLFSHVVTLVAGDIPYFQVQTV